jgi:chemotaxis protein CheX
VNAAAPALPSGAGHELWLPTLQLATQEVFELMLATVLDIPVSAELEEEGLDITAMVGLAGQLCGILKVRCSAQSASRMASRMLGINPEQAGPEMWDAVGEICNMIAGNFKNKINGLGDGCMLSMPTVIAGGDYRVRSVYHEELRIVLLFEGSPVVLTLEIHS